MDLEQAEQVFRNERWIGVTCPCCKRFGKVYRRSINRPMARVLLALARRPGEYVKIGNGGIGTAGGDYAKLRWWRLIESMPDDVRADGSPRVGLWRITDLGFKFVCGAVSVNKYVYEYDGEPVDAPPHIEPYPVTFASVLGEPFDYESIMRVAR